MKQKNVILMVVAVGCGLVAAFLTSQMSGKTVEQVEVIVAAKDLPVGTMLTRDELEKCVKTKKVPKDGLPPSIVTNKDDLVDKRLSRPIRAEETFNPQDLNKHSAITLPPGHSMVSMPVGVGQAAAGFVGPGSRVDVLATVRLNNKLNAFPLLLNMLVVAVNTQTTYASGDSGAFPNLSMVSFAVRGKEALLLSLAKARGCNLELMLRHPEADVNENNDNRIEEMIRLISDDTQKADIAGTNNSEDKKPVAPVKVEDPKVETPKDPAPSAPAPTIAVVKVPVAKRDIAPNTEITKDLIEDAFEWKELPKDFAADALTDFTEALGKAFKTGVSKSQWVTWTMVGLQAPKVPPQETFQPPKPGVVEATPANPVQPPAAARPVSRPRNDVAVHGPNGTIIHRYEEVAPGQWKKVAELTPEQAARSSQPEPPKPAPNPKVD